MPRKSFIWKIPKKDFRKAISESTSWTAVARRYYTSIGNIKVLKSRVQKEGLDISHFVGKSWAGGLAQRKKTPKYTLEQLLVKDSKATHRTRLKERLIQEKKMQSKCYVCGLDPVWNGKPLNLHLYHVNGDSHDNRIDNLALLCPNCRSQARPKYAKLKFIKICNCGKDIDDDVDMCRTCKRKQRRPSRQDLELEIAVIGISGVSRKYKKDEATIKDWLLNSP